uniref:hypothetical protein n=1 Tax=Rhodobacter viridis TaxID=1054202 RepID=UPI0015E895EC|nr:hypothetical protein [Rhodobacter viridis]
MPAWHDFRQAASARGGAWASPIAAPGPPQLRPEAGQAYVARHVTAFDPGPYRAPDDQDRAMGTPLVRVPWRGMDLSKLKAKHDQGDFLRSLAEAVLQLIMDFEREAIDPADRSWPRKMSKA